MQTGNGESHESGQAQRGRWSISLRELMMLAVIVGLGLTVAYRNRPEAASNALFVEEGPVMIQYWHQRDDRGSGTSGWQETGGFEVHADFILVHRDGGGFMIPQENLTRFGWRRQPQRATPARVPGAGH